MNYRPDIDGLRAVAVVSVVFFHANLDSFRGGYVGVDIFFVISGYLITSILINDLNKGQFSLINFYERRARRILPALFLVAIACLPFALILMIPDELKDFSYSLMSMLGFSSNVYFWKTSGYFDTSSDLKPLMHTWSLAVEEQYYLLFPVLLFVMSYIRRQILFFVLLAISVFSLVVAEWVTRINPNAGFYLLPTRAWQLGIGALLAIGAEQSIRAVHGWVANLGGALGLMMIAYAIFVFDETYPVPGYWGVVPVLGAALVIACGHNGGWGARLLSWRPIVWIGLISYSAYLWHQPIFAFLRMATFGEASGPAFAVAILLTFGLAYVSWSQVEQPWRQRQRFPRRQVFAWSLVGSVVLLSSAAVLAALPPRMVMPTQEKTPPACNWWSGGDFDDCEVANLDETADRTVVLWGDSYADTLAPALSRVLTNGERTAFIPIISHSCPSLINTRRNEAYRIGRGFAEKCTAHIERTRRLLPEMRPDVVILTSSYLYHAQDINPYNGRPVLLHERDRDLDGEQVVVRSLIETVAFIESTGARVVLVTPHPIVEDFVHRQRWEMLWGTSSTRYEVDTVAAERLRSAILKGLAAADLTVTEVPMLSLLCERNEQTKGCSIFNAEDGVRLVDESHISPRLATRVAERIDELL